MKKIIQYISQIIVVSFMVFICLQQYGYTIFSTYTSVMGIGVKEGKTLQVEKIKEELTKLAVHEDSLIAQRIILRSGEYVYEVYGNKNLPNGLKRATSEEIKNSSMMGGFIIEGHIHPETISAKLLELGYENTGIYRGSFLSVSMQYLFNSVFIIVILSLLLAYFATGLIEHVKWLRSSAVHYMAGESLSQIIGRGIFQDVKSLVWGDIISVGIVFISTWFLHIFQWRILAVLLVSVLLFSLFLFVLTCVFSLVDAFGLKRRGLAQILKGRTPLNRLLGLMVCTQLIAIVGVGAVNETTYKSYQRLIVHHTASSKWKAYSDIGTIGFNANAEKGGFNAKTSDPWYQFLVNEFLYHGAMLSEHNATKLAFQAGENKKLTLNEYDPRANTLYVSLNYLKQEKVKEIQPKDWENLAVGEFGLLLPESLRSQENFFKEKYTKYMNSLLEDHHSSVLMRPKVSYMPNHQKRFIFNAASIVPTQFLKDPILVVVNPKTFPSTLFWDQAFTYGVFVKEGQDLENRIAQYGMEKWVSGIYNGLKIYSEAHQRSVVETSLSFFGGIMGILASILLFNTMSALYFEQFRKEVFIKRMAGQTFLQNHKVYIILQLTIVLIGISFMNFLLKESWLGRITGIWFLFNSIVILWIQNRKEEKQAVTILKGQQ